MKKILPCFIILLLFASASSYSQNTACYNKAADKIMPGKKINLVTDQGKLSGELVEIDLFNRQITIDQQLNDNINGTTVSFDNINEIKYSERGHFQPKYVILGTLGGVLLGGTVGYLASSNTDTGWEGTDETAKALATIGCAFIGGVVGLLAGAIIPTELNSTVTIKCY